MGGETGVRTEGGSTESLSGAANICLHAGGSADIGALWGVATPGLSMSWRGFGLSHKSRSLPQPSSVGGTGCDLHSGLPGGQLMRR